MTRKHRPLREFDADATVDAGMLGHLPDSTAPTVSRPDLSPPRCRRGILGHATPHLSEDTRSLLRVRLRAVALVSLTAFGLFLAWQLLPYENRYPTSSLLLVMHIFTLLVTAACAMVVWRVREMCIYTLRTIEALLIGVPAVYFLLLTGHKISSVCCLGTVFAPDPIEPWIILIFTYSLFIPNSWRRALCVNGVLAATPIATLLFLYLTNESVEKVYTANEIVPICLSMVVTCVAATLGAHLINSLRHEAFEYRQLGQYRLGMKIGSGGMGEVYLAEHQMLKRPCAIKVIRPTQALDPRSLARFEREVMAMARLSHWNTVEVYDYGREEDGTFFYVMEFLPGLNLHDLVEKHGPLPPGRVIYLMRQLCDALAEAHAAGLLHRDIKPSNIFAAQRGGLCDVAKLLDFGLVKTVAETVSSRITQDGAIPGTPQFMSPEQADQRSLDGRSDLYSLGAVAYFLLTGRPPFDDPRPLVVLIAHSRDPVIPLSQLRPEVPEDLEQVILRCLAKNPAERFPDARALAEALDACRDAASWTPEEAERWWAEIEGLDPGRQFDSTSGYAPAGMTAS